MHSKSDETPALPLRYLPVLCLFFCCAATGLERRESTRLAERATRHDDLVSFAPQESNADVVNPERGYFVSMNLLAAGDAARVRASGHSLAIAIVRLDAYRQQPLDVDLLVGLGRGFEAARAAGIKVILRFTYNAAFQTDASRAQIIAHIWQLAWLLQHNSDVIAVMQAGFIGAWGEWHHSTNGLDNTADRSAILNAILQALPETRSVQVRRPMFKASILGGSALAPGEAYGRSARARIGHHNDCFLSSKSDSGTYGDPVSRWKSFVAADGRYTPVGGETCTPSKRTDCATALAELSEQNWSFLNRQHDDRVVASWYARGCGHEINNRLGYRFVALRVAHSPAVRPGGELAVEIDVANRGFAAPFNFRTAYVVLRHQSQRHVAYLSSVDVRRWAPGQVSRVTTRLRVPADLAPGTYELALWLPDDAPRLQPDPRYAIRLANDGVFDEKTGDNVLSTAVRVDAAAPGGFDGQAKTFVELR